jgi:hypothetical protein
VDEFKRILKVNARLNTSLTFIHKQRFYGFFFDFIEVFEVACKIQQDIVMHPFAFRTHAHKLGK